MTTPADLEPLASELVVHAARLTRAVRRALDHPASARALSLLDERGPLGITELAVLDHCSQPTMSGVVGRLEELGQVDRRADPADGRRSVIVLNPAGAAELARLRARNGALVARRLRTQSPDDVATAVAVLRAVLSDSEGDL